MKQYAAIPLLSVLLGGGGFALRLMQNRTGFDASTGLPVSGNLYALALPILLAAAALGFLALAKKLPDGQDSAAPSFEEAFSSSSAGILSLSVAGLFLWLLSGAYDAYLGLSVTFSRLDLLTGLLGILAAVSQLPVAAACRRGSGKALNGNLLLIPVVYAVIRLVLAYREDSVNPALSAYYTDLLALVFLILACYRASSFAFQCGRTRRFFVYAALSAVLGITTLADSHTLAGLLFYGGGALWVLGLMLLRSARLAGQTPEAEETP